MTAFLPAFVYKLHECVHKLHDYIVRLVQELSNLAKPNIYEVIIFSPFTGSRIGFYKTPLTRQGQYFNPNKQ